VVAVPEHKIQSHLLVKALAVALAEVAEVQALAAHLKHMLAVLELLVKDWAGALAITTLIFNQMAVVAVVLEPQVKMETLVQLHPRKQVLAVQD
jgi:hypothetical protein